MTEQTVKLPICYQNEAGLLEKITFPQNFQSPKALVDIENYFVTTTVVNSIPSPITIDELFKMNC